MDVWGGVVEETVVGCAYVWTYQFVVRVYVRMWGDRVQGLMYSTYVRTYVRSYYN